MLDDEIIYHAAGVLLFCFLFERNMQFSGLACQVLLGVVLHLQLKILGFQPLQPKRVSNNPATCNKFHPNTAAIKFYGRSVQLLVKIIWGIKTYRKGRRRWQTGDNGILAIESASSLII